MRDLWLNHPLRSVMAEHPINQGRRMHYKKTCLIAPALIREATEISLHKTSNEKGLTLGIAGFLDFAHRPVF
jgi:hypothetical protein